MGRLDFATRMAKIRAECFGLAQTRLGRKFPFPMRRPAIRKLSIVYSTRKYFSKRLRNDCRKGILDLESRIYDYYNDVCLAKTSFL